ncbi:MAG: hypothetical protein WKF37_20775 [Bryobacteraceae bacterium]
MKIIFWVGACCAILCFGEAVKLVQRAVPLAPLTEPPCSYASTQNRKGLVKPDDRVVAWVRGAHNGGAIPIRLFISVPRVINDTYGLFFFDPDGGYVSAFKKDYGYQSYGWRRGVMTVKGGDGTLWSALSGRAIDGPQKGKHRGPKHAHTWTLADAHPGVGLRSLDGQRLPCCRPLSPRLKARWAASTADPPLAMVMGVEGGNRKAYPLDPSSERTCYRDKMGTEEFAVFWYTPKSLSPTGLEIDSSLVRGPARKCAFQRQGD